MCFVYISYLIDGLKTELKLLTRKAEVGLLYLLCSFKREETTIHFIMYRRKHLISMEEIQSSMREIQGKSKMGLISNIVDYSNFQLVDSHSWKHSCSVDVRRSRHVLA